MDQPESFFQQDAVTCARALIGATLLVDGCGGPIVETEAYLGEDDPACHTISRPSARAFVQEHPPGTAYVYLNYGVHFMLNFLTGPDRIFGFVLIRAIQPTHGLPTLRERRPNRSDRQLCSGPGKLTAALAINAAHHATPILQPGSGCSIQLPPQSPPVLADGRIGISRATDFPYRFTHAHRQPWTSRPARLP